MKKISKRDDWPESWKQSFEYDLEEIFGVITNPGYAYAYANRSKTTIEFVTSYVPRGSRVLDIAAAQGNFSLRLAELGYQVTWNDLREELAEYVKLKYEFGSIEYAAGDVFKLNLAQQFDCVLITEIIEHVAHPDEFLSKVSTLVRPGGVIVMTTPNGGYFRNTLPRFSDCVDPSVYESIQFKPNSDGHIFLLHSDEIQTIAIEAGLEVVRLEHFTTPLTNGHMKLHHLLSILPKSAIVLLERISYHLPMALQTRFFVHTGAVFQKTRSRRDINQSAVGQ